MYNCKHLFFYVFFLLVIPFQFITAQNTSADGSQNNELDNKYDSVISKAAFSLTSAQYKQASDYYKEASLLKPQEMYPHKMIKYVEGIMTDEAAKQKRIDDLTQKAQIKNDLNKANKAIVNGSWDSARLLFTEILTLNPSKTDEDYAKSKIEAIDLELKRIVLRTPPKPEPVIIAPPKNRSEARARRKLEERNAFLQSMAAKEKTQNRTQAPLPQKPVAAPVQSRIETSSVQKNSVAVPAKEIPLRQVIRSSSAPVTSANNNLKTHVSPNRIASGQGNTVSYQTLQSFNENFKNASNVIWKVSPRFATAAFLEDDEKVEAVFDLDGVLIGTSRYVSINELPREVKRIFATKYPGYKIKEVIRYEGVEEAGYLVSSESDKERVIFRLTGGKDISVLSRDIVEKNIAAAEVNKGVQQKSTDAVPTNKTSTASTSTQQPSQTLSAEKKLPLATTSTNQIQQKSIELAQAKNLATTPGHTEIHQQPVATPLPQKPVAAAPAHTEIHQQPIATPLPQTPVVAAPVSKEIVQKPIATPLPQKPVVAVLVTKETVKKQTELPLPEKNIAAATADKSVAGQPMEAPSHRRNSQVTSLPIKELQQKPAEASVQPPNAPVTAPFSNEVPNTSAGASSLNLADSSNYIKLICKDITFIGTNAYVKVLIQNYSETASFLTDTLLVSLKKNNGVVTKLDQRFISSFPVVAPLKELILVSFADASVGVDPDDTFILEMEDKTSKTKLSLQIPWALYKQQKNL